MLESDFLERSMSSRPLINGIRMSVTTTSGYSSRMVSKASMPFFAVATSS